MTSTQTSEAAPDLVFPGVELFTALPCLDGEATLQVCVGKSQDSLRRLGVAGEVVIADNDVAGFVTQPRGGADLVTGDRFQGCIAPGAMPSVTFSLTRIGAS